MNLKRLQLKFKWQVRDALHFLGVKADFFRRRGQVQFLCFHGVCKDSESFINARYLKESQFKKLVKQLCEEFHVISLEEYLSGKINSEKLNVVLTFDDGYKNNKELILPIAEGFNVPLTFFVTTGTTSPLWMDLLDICYAVNCTMTSLESQFPITKGMSNEELKQWVIEQPPEDVVHVAKVLKKIADPYLDRFKTFWELMSPSDLVEMNEHPLVTLANHSANHLSFIRLSLSQVNNEFSNCVTMLQQFSSAMPQVFAYPYGHYNASTSEILQCAGCTTQFSTDDLKNKGRANVIGRLVINPFISTHNQLRAIADGYY